MAIKLSNFVFKDSISVLVHFPMKLSKIENSKESGYILDKMSKEKIHVIDYLNEFSKYSEKIEQVMRLVKLKDSLRMVSLKELTKLEYMKVQLASILLINSKVMIFEYFFDDMISSEKEYFMRLLRNLLYKQNKKIILIENDMNFVGEIVKKFYLFTTKGRYELITDFYQDKIYLYVEMPYTVSLIKYLESKGHIIDHEITFSETLKAIYRGVE